MCRLGNGAGHLHGLDGHVVRWRGSLYMLHHTLGRDAVLCPMYGPGGSMQVCPLLQALGAAA